MTSVPPTGEREGALGFCLHSINGDCRAAARIEGLCARCHAWVNDDASHTPCPCSADPLDDARIAPSAAAPAQPGEGEPDALAMFDRYGEHDGDCASLRADDCNGPIEHDCSCGFAAARALLERRGGKGLSGEGCGA